MEEKFSCPIWFFIRAILLCFLGCLVQKSKNPIATSERMNERTNKHLRHSAWLNVEERKESIRVHKISMQCPSVYESAVNLLVMPLSFSPFHFVSFSSLLALLPFAIYDCLNKVHCLRITYTQNRRTSGMFDEKILSLATVSTNEYIRAMNGRKSFDHIVTSWWQKILSSYLLSLIK